MTLKEYALACVEAICQERLAQHKHPVFASLHDILRMVNDEVQAALEELATEGRLAKTENVNKTPMFYPQKITKQCNSKQK